MESFFSKYLDLVFFVYGLAFFIMGTAILAQPKEKSEFGLAGILWLLAAFCFIHGLNEFLDMWAIIKGSGQAFDLIRLVILTTSYFFLFEFGRRLFIMAVSAAPAQYKKLSKLLPAWLAIFIGCVIALRFILYAHDWAGAGTFARYFLGFFGGVLTGAGFILYYDFNRGKLAGAKIKQAFLIAGTSFIIYGILGGLVVPKGHLFFSGWLNADAFLAVFRIPVQLARAICASTAAWAMCRILIIFSWEREALIESHASAVEIINKQLHGEIAFRIKLEEDLRTLSFTDPLTGLYNYRGFLALGEQQIKIAKRSKQNVLLIFADLDNLKWINDNLGHKAGDSSLIEVAGVIKYSFRESDIIARIGGDEFVVLAVQAEKESADKLIAKLQNKLKERNEGDPRGHPLSLSVGKAYCDASVQCSIDELLSQADKSMYEQKKTKNRI